MESQVLWIHSPAGFGKTFLSAKIVAHFENTSSHPLAYFFCVHYDAEKKNPLSILRSFIAQIAAHRVDAFKQVKLAWKGNETRTLSASELWSLFRAIITKVPFCRFIIDGFDECSTEDPEDRTHFTEARSRFLTNILSSIHLSSTSSLLIVSRDEVDIREGLVPINHNQQLMRAMEYAIHEEDNQADIRLFAQHATRKALRRHPQDVQEEMASELSSKAQGMFMWVRLEKDRLRSNQSAQQLRETLASMPRGMDRLQKMYGRSLLVISNLQEPSDRDRAVNILRWTLYATRPLSVGELLDALIVRPEMTELPEDHLLPIIDEEYVQQSITALCGSLVDIRSAENPSEIQNSTVHLAHFSVKEYLQSCSIFSSEHPEVFQSLKHHNINHGLLAVSCLTYLSARQFSDGPLPSVEANKANLAKYPLLKYAALSWATHARLASSDQSCIRATLGFFASGQNLEHWDDVYQWSTEFYEGPPRLSDPGFSLEYGIYFSAYFGLEDALKVLLTEPNIDLNYVGLLGTALQAASSQGEESIVRLLLNQGADPNVEPLSDGQPISSSTALQSASWSGYIGIVDLLLQHGADLLHENDGFQDGNALCYACDRGHEAIVRLMVERGANVNSGDYLTPLEAASNASGDLEGMVQLLLESGADINARSGLSDGMGALQSASYQGNGAVVQLLLAKRADVNAQGGQFGNALQAASLFGRETIVLLLLDKRVDVNAQGGCFGSALQAASANGNEATVRLLLGSGADANSQGGHFGNALQAASFGGHKETVQLLIASGANVNAQGGYYSRIGRPAGHGPEVGTALVTASSLGYTDVVQLLLARGADTNLLGRTWDNVQQGWLYNSPLQLALANGHGGVVRLLRTHNLEEADARSLSIPNNNSHTTQLETINEYTVAMDDDQVHTTMISHLSPSFPLGSDQHTQDDLTGDSDISDG
jgi:ankyrin repeat protein